MKSTIVQHFIFGYGSLISSKSRAVTVPEHADKVVTPVVVQGLERVWTKRTAMGMTAMGVQFADDDNPDAECIGVLLPVTEQELAEFDRREKGYKRVLLDQMQVNHVPFLDKDEHYSEPEHEIVLDAIGYAATSLIDHPHSTPVESSAGDSAQNSGDDNETDDDDDDSPAVKIWVYVNIHSHTPTPEHPIAQSYLDTILRGCLEISPEFAAEFLETTAGWHPDEAVHEDSILDKGAADDQVPIVNDRQDPVYIRGDPTWSLKQAAMLDKLIHKHRPDIIRHRNHKMKHVHKKHQQQEAAKEQEQRDEGCTTQDASTVPVQHFVFGYGSLISSKSRAVTVPEHADTVVTPVTVEGLERVWTKRTNRGMTAMGVQFADEENPGAECVGVLLPVTEEELAEFDKREVGYGRLLLDPEFVNPVSFLDKDEHYSEPEHEVVLDVIEDAGTEATNGREGEICNTESGDENETDDVDVEIDDAPEVKIWVYVPLTPMAPTPEHPIVQSYIDTILRGCLEISPEFAAEFLETTAGWHPNEAVHEDSIIDEGAGAEQIPIVNDRHEPVYIRGDPTWSRKKADVLDRLIHKHRPDLIRHRSKHNIDKVKKTKPSQKKVQRQEATKVKVNPNSSSSSSTGLENK